MKSPKKNSPDDKRLGFPDSTLIEEHMKIASTTYG